MSDKKREQFIKGKRDEGEVSLDSTIENEIERERKRLSRKLRVPPVGGQKLLRATNAF